MGELAFIGLGLNRETDISLRGLEKAKCADAIFAEFYTSLMTELNVQRLEKLLGKRVQIVMRRNLEEEGGKMILEEARKGKVAFLTPGDPLIATTHVDLRIRAQKKRHNNERCSWCLSYFCRHRLVRPAKLQIRPKRNDSIL